MENLIRMIEELHPEKKITRDSRLIEDRILDSLDIVSLVTDINDKYAISIGAEDIIAENFHSLDALASLVGRCGGNIICP